MPQYARQSLVNARAVVPGATNVTTLRELDAQSPGCLLHAIPRDPRPFRGSQVKVGKSDPRRARFRRTRGVRIRRHYSWNHLR